MFLRRSTFLRYSNIRFQQTQAKVVNSVKKPQNPLEELGFGPVFKNARLFPEKIAIRDRIAGEK